MTSLVNTNRITCCRFDLAVTASLKEAEIQADVIIEEDTELKEDERVTE